MAFHEITDDQHVVVLFDWGVECRIGEDKLLADKFTKDRSEVLKETSSLVC
jgi:hypothetical protein